MTTSHTREPVIQCCNMNESNIGWIPEGDYAALQQQNASLLQEFNNVCNQRDQLKAINTGLLAALKTIKRGGIIGADMMQIASEAIAKAGVK